MFVAGSCFAIKAKLLEPIKKLNIKIDNFLITKREAFSLAHVMERYVCACIIDQKYTFYGNNICKLRRFRWKKLENELSKHSAMSILKESKYIFNNDFIYFDIEMSFIKEYKVEEILLKDINRELEGNIYKLKDCSPYKYLEGNKKRYQQYCDYHQKNSIANMSINRYEKLIHSINENGYDERFIICLNGNNNVIVDGQHRACYLLYKYGDNFKINVLKLYYISYDLNTVRPFCKKIKIIK